MVTLTALTGYVNRELVYRAGEQFQVDEAEALFLETDAPGVFKRVEAPTTNKMVKQPALNKAIKTGNG
jgi:hypothetical protein